MKKRVSDFVGNISGATAIEYGLIVGIMSVIIIAGSVHELHFQQNGGGWGKTAAAVGAGILIGVLFG